MVIPCREKASHVWTFIHHQLNYVALTWTLFLHIVKIGMFSRILPSFLHLYIILNSCIQWCSHNCDHTNVKNLKITLAKLSLQFFSNLQLTKWNDKKNTITKKISFLHVWTHAWYMNQGNFQVCYGMNHA